MNRENADDGHDDVAVDGDGPDGTGVNIRAGIPFDMIVSLMRQRRSQDSVLIRAMIDVRDRYNNDVTLPLVDVQGAPTMEPPVPRLIAQAVDGTAMRAASPNPTIVVPALDPSSSRSRDRAETRRRRLYGAWKENQVAIKTYRSYRHLVGYGTCCWTVLPTNLKKRAVIEVRDPLTAYPELRDPSDIRAPRNVGFVYGRSIDWITSRFPRAMQFFNNSAGRNWDTLWDVVEWIDEDEIVIGILGPRMPAYSPQDSRPYGYSGFELCRFVNKAGMVPISIPRRVTLDMVMGQMQSMISTVDLHSRLMALEVAAAEKHVFPDMVALADPNGAIRIVGGNWRDGRTGEVNLLEGARAIQLLTTQPNPGTAQVIGALEEAIRENGGASSMFGGTGQGNFNPRTGNAISQMGAFAVDPRVEEVQLIQAQALSTLNEAVLAVEKGYYPSAKQWVFTGLQGDASMVEYQPDKDFDCLENHVDYPIPGADVSQTSVAVAQLSGAGLISKHTARVKHPWIDDATLEERLLAVEMVEAAALSGFAQQVNGGQVPLVDAVAVLKKVRGGMVVETAINQQQEAAQQRQATPGTAPATGQVASPQSQPGLSMPGMGAEQPPPGPTGPGGPAIAQPPASLANLHGLLRNLSAAPPQAPTGGPV